MFCRVIFGNPNSPDHTFYSGDGILISTSIDLDVDELGGSCNVTLLDLNSELVKEYYTIIFDSNGLEPPTIDFSQLERIEVDENQAVNSININNKTTGEQVNPNTKAGQQISVELGDKGIPYIRYEFINDSIDFNNLTKIITFGGSVASKVMTQYSKNTAYSNLNFKELAVEIASKYGLSTEFPDNGPNPTYEYIPQIGLSDYQFLLSEAKRIGYRVQTISATLKFDLVENHTENSVTLTWGKELLNTSFSYQVETSGNNSVRDSVGNSNNSKNTRKFTINDKGLIEPIRSQDESITETTGSAVEQTKPISNDTGVTVEKENELRVKGITGNFDILFNRDTSRLDPFHAVITEKLTDPLSRVWIPEKVGFEYNSNQIRVYAQVYSPLKPKYKQVTPPTPTPVSSEVGEDIPLDPNGKTVNQILIEQWNRNRGFSSRSGPGGGNVACVWAINKLFTWGGINPLWGGSLAVVGARSALKSSSNGVQIRVGTEKPGDICLVLMSDGFRGHIGLVTGTGRSISNSSSRAAFVWNSSLFFPESYRGATIREVWRDTRTF